MADGRHPLEGGKSCDVLEELAQAHREVASLFARLMRVPPGAVERRRLLAECGGILTGHLAREEEHVYPAVRAWSPGGEQLAQRELTAHDVLRKLLAEARDAGPADFDQLLTALHNEVKHHLHDEQHTVFPLLRQRCRAGQREALGTRLRQARLATVRATAAGPVSRGPA